MRKGIDPEKELARARARWPDVKTMSDLIAAEGPMRERSAKARAALEAAQGEMAAAKDDENLGMVLLLALTRNESLDPR